MTDRGCASHCYDAKRDKTQLDKLLEEINLVKMQIQNANTRFEQTSDSDLVESAIYEIQSLKAKYRYLVKSAKLLDIS